MIKIIAIFLFLISHALCLEGADPHEQKPADVQAFQKAEYEKIKSGPQPLYETCQPFYKRLFYNLDQVPEGFRRTIERGFQEETQKEESPQKIINIQKQSETDPERPLDMFIYFNTNISCPRSYVTIELFQSKIMRFDCIQERIHLEANGTGWQQFVHKCRVIVPIERAAYIQSFKYTVYGQVVNLESQKARFTPADIKSYQKKVRASETIQIQLVRKEITTKIIVLGDWAPIKIRPYFPIHESLVHLIDLRRQQKRDFPGQNQYRFGALVIAGDIAYNLQDFNGMKYNWFMSELQKVSPYWPIVIFPGNHDDITPGNRYLLANSFEIGRLSIEDGNFTRVRWMRFPNLVNFVMFNPFNQIYNKGTADQTNQMVSYLKSTIDQVQTRYPNQFTIAMSHYPIACSQMDDNHCNGMLLTNITKELLDFMSTERNGKPRPIDMYVGSHMHQFQRVFPYANGTFQIGQKSVYARGHMVSVVQGAAGCDYGMISSDFKRQNFSVSATYNKTGYAFMTIYGTSETVDKSKYVLNYRHVAARPAPDYYEDIDEFTIYGKLPVKDAFEQILESLKVKIWQFDKNLQEISRGLQTLLLSE